MKQTEFVSKCADKSAFTALLNCAEVGRRNQISSKLPISVPLLHHNHIKMVAIQIGEASPIKAVGICQSACNAAAICFHSLEELVHLFSAANVGR